MTRLPTGFRMTAIGRNPANGSADSLPTPTGAAKLARTVTDRSGRQEGTTAVAARHQSLPIAHIV